MSGKRTVASSPKREATTGGGDKTYYVALRTREMKITASVQDRVLYPRAVAWNRLLTSDRGRQSDQPADRRAWQESGLEAIVELAEAGGVTRSDVDAFIVSAASCGEVQVEMEWEAENIGWAARVFPWEALIALSTKQAREKLGDESRGILVVRWLRCKDPFTPAATGPFCFAVSAEVKQAGHDTDTEHAAIEAAIDPQKLVDISPGSLAQLGDQLQRIKPQVLHFITPSTRDVRLEETVVEGQKLEGQTLEDIAKTVAANHPQLVAFSSCHTGRRLAPLAVAHGANLAVGFHDDVMDSSCPVYFGAFYREWTKTGHVFDALREGLEAHNWKKSPNDLGGVTIWSATDLLHRPKRTAKKVAKTTMRPSSVGQRLETPELILGALKVTCVLENALNYSMLHNKRGGLFATFGVLKLKPGKIDDLEITVKLDAGLDRPVECHFFAAIPDQPDRTVDFMENITVPLGSELLRRRGEMLRGTVEVAIGCGSVRVFHSFDSIELPPCDEWKDDEAGRRFLPSFIFPRDPAVREILTSAQPFLRALKDDVRAAFDGYQSQAIPANSGEIASLPAQLRSIWGALQQNCRLDYTNPPPSYTRNVQRVRTPEEIMRSRRATCLELALLLAACWEHIGLYPVIFLSKGHAFTGYWESEAVWLDFFDTKKRLDAGKKISPAAEGVQDNTLDAIDPARASGGGMDSKDPDWLLRATHHLALISREVKAGRLVAVEATSVARLESFHESIDLGRAQLAEAFAAGSFDGMIDVRTARDQRVTPLAIMTEGVVA